jgi:hypothetical protein
VTTWRIAAAVAAASAVIAGTGLPATASEFGTLGIGTRVTPTENTGMYAAPGLSTPRVGMAWQNDNVAAVCGRQDSNGRLMVLGIDRPGRTGEQWANTVGYIWSGHLSGVPNAMLTCTAYLPYTTLRDTGLYTAPGLSTPRVGTVGAGQRFFGICKIPDSNGRRMVLGVAEFGRAGGQWAETAGYIWGDDVAGSTDSMTDCGIS